eukprot:3871521-Amphidinium_carterae.1
MRSGETLLAQLQSTLDMIANTCCLGQRNYNFGEYYSNHEGGEGGRKLTDRRTRPPDRPTRGQPQATGVCDQAA